MKACVNTTNTRHFYLYSNTLGHVSVVFNVNELGTHAQGVPSDIMWRF